MDDKDKRLYPVRFLEDGSETPWGSVCYHIADLGFRDSRIADGWFGGNSLSELMGTYMERVTGDDAFEYYGLQFPLMVKVMKTTGWQPLQVNVGDAEAEERYDAMGKTAMWYVSEAEEDARIYLGLDRDVSAEEFFVRCQDDTLKDILNVVEPIPGDSFMISPGTVYAAGPGLTIIEIGECSEMSFTIQDPLLLEEAFDLIDFGKYTSGSFYPSDNVRSADPTTGFAGGPPSYYGVPTKGGDLPPSGAVALRLGGKTILGKAEGGHGCRGVDAAGKILAECEMFTVRKMDLRDPLHIFSEQPGSFAIYHCLSGEAAVQPYGDAQEFPVKTVKAGKTILIPSEVNDYLILPTKEGTTLLEAVAERRVPRDSYTGDDGDNDGSEAPDPHVRNWN